MKLGLSKTNLDDVRVEYLNQRPPDFNIQHPIPLTHAASSIHCHLPVNVLPSSYLGTPHCRDLALCTHLELPFSHPLHHHPSRICQVHFIILYTELSLNDQGSIILFYHSIIIFQRNFQGKDIDLEKNPSTRWDLNPRPSVI